MQLEIQFAVPNSPRSAAHILAPPPHMNSPIRQHGPVIGLPLDALKEPIKAPTHLDQGDVARRGLAALDDCPGPPEFLQHGWSGSAASVSITKQDQRLLGDFEVLVARLTTPNLVNVGLGVVSVDRGHVSQHLTAIETDPIEGRMRERVAAYGDRG